MFKYHKGQVSLEFFAYIGMALLILIIVSIIAINQIPEVFEDLSLENVASLIQKEISIASTITYDYERTFLIPEKIKGKTYTIEIIKNTTLSVRLDDKELIKRIFPTSGQPVFGINILKKNGELHLNE